MTKIYWISCFLLLFSCAAVTDSTNVKTSGIHASYTVQNDGYSQIKVTASLTVGSGGIIGTELKLAGGDQLVAKVGETTQALHSEENPILGSIRYVTTFDIEDSREPFKIQFQRTSEQSALESMVFIPRSFQISQPTHNSVYQFGETIPLSTSELAYQDIDLTIRCKTNDNIQLKEFAHFKGPRNQITPEELFHNIYDHQTTGRPDKSKPCEIELVLSASEEGLLDKNFGEGGIIVGKQIRSVTFKAYPPK